MPKPLRLIKRTSVDDLTQPGDFCFVYKQNGEKKVMLACPVCGTIMACPHTVLLEEPLTLALSIVGPFRAAMVTSSECGHHFWVRDGFIFDA